MRDEYQIEIQYPDAKSPADFKEEETPHIFVVPKGGNNEVRYGGICRRHHRNRQKGKR